MKKSPVWEITGAEFTKNQIHTADGISIRFPRVTKERSDKDWEQATDLPQLKVNFFHFTDGLTAEILGKFRANQK